MHQPIVIPFNRLLITLSLLVWLSIPLFILYQAFNASSLGVMIFCVLCFMLMVGTSFRYVFDVLETYRQESLLVIDEQGINYAPSAPSHGKILNIYSPIWNPTRVSFMFMVLRSKLKNLSLMLPKSSRTSANHSRSFLSCKFPDTCCPYLLKK